MFDLESAEWDNYHTWLVTWAYGRAGHRLNTCPTCRRREFEQQGYNCSRIVRIHEPVRFVSSERAVTVPKFG